MARRRRRSRRGRSSAGKAAFGGLLIVLALGAFGGIGYAVWREAGRGGIDAASLCLEDGPAGQLASLLDTTDSVAPAQLDTARARIEALIADVPDFTRGSFATVSPDRAVRDASFSSLCKPPRDASALTGNPRIVAERYRDASRGPMERHLDGVLTIPVADSSPILNAMSEFLAELPGFGAGEGTGMGARQVVLVTDLVQHSDTFSFYRGGDWASFAASGNLAC